MKVDLIDHMGSDLTVVNAARVSFDKHHDEFADPADERLLDYLARNGHWTPYAHPQAQFRVTCALFVAAQLKRHVVGASLNEVSRRYVDDDPDFDALVWRRRPDKSIKQGSGAEFGEEMQALLSGTTVHVWSVAVEAYNAMLASGVAPEQARAVLPQITHTSWYWTASLYFWANLCIQRLHPHAQQETRDVALAIQEHMRRLFPVSWEKLMHYGGVK